MGYAGCGCGPGYGSGYGNGSGFALIVVLFILLIIIGASFLNTGGCDDRCWHCRYTIRWSRRSNLAVTFITAILYGRLFTLYYRRCTPFSAPFLCRWMFSIDRTIIFLHHDEWVALQIALPSFFSQNKKHTFFGMRLVILFVINFRCLSANFIHYSYLAN